MKIRNDDRIAYREGNFSELSEEVKAFLDEESKLLKDNKKKPVVVEAPVFEQEELESK